GELVARKERRLGGIILESQPLKEISDEERINILTEAVRNSNLELLSWTESAIHLQERILNLRKWRPEEGWPDLNRDHMLATIESWLPPWLATVKKKDDFRKISLEQIFLAMVDWKLQDKIDKLAPEKILVPSGSWIKVKYQADGSQPVLAVRLQEIFGMKETPLINEGRTKLLIHLLSPAFRAVQVTQDLASFWKNTYPEVRKELRTRYPKHHWPDDPYTAEAVRGARRKR
ncbi:MAG TPA: ATP-dependent helicase C-terminal domain-containing protein, partial [Bacteroidia bacterium]|nr:ATP-dependent helicase C-terminal domain-containing protein [Bacteroidia bacterium]